MKTFKGFFQVVPIVIVLMTFGFSNSVSAQSCASGEDFDLDENEFPQTCVTSNGAEGSPSTATFDHDFATSSGGTYTSGTDGINDVTVTMSTTCSFPNGTNGTTQVGACLGPNGLDVSQAAGLNNVGTVDGSSDFGGATVNDNPCANCWVVVEYDFINGFSSTADGFDLDWSSMNGSTEGLEAWGGWVEGSTFSAPTVTVSDLTTYCNSQAGTGLTMMEHITGTAVGGSLPAGVFRADAITGATACPTEEPPSTSGPNSTVGTGMSSGAIPPNWGLTATDEITKLTMIYLMSNSNGPDCDGDVSTEVNTSPSGSLSTVDFCIPASCDPPTLSATTTNTCPGLSEGAIDLTTTGGTGTFTYLWDDAAAQTTATPTGLAAGTYTVTVTVDGDATCTVEAMYTVGEFPAPTVSASSNSPVCIGDNIELTATFTAGVSSTSAASWSWTGPNSFSSMLQNPIAFATVAASAGTYTVEVTDNNGCKNTADVIVVINELPSVNMGFDEVCAGSSLDIPATPTGGLAPYTHSWTITDPGTTGATDAANLTNANTSTVTFDATGLTAGFIPLTYTVTDANGCVNSATLDLFVRPLPMVSASINSPVCIGDNIELTATFTADGTSTAAAMWSWTGPNGFTSTMEDPPAFASTAAAAGTYTVEVTDNNGCKNTADVEVVVNPLPIPTLESNSPYTCITSDSYDGIEFTASGGTLYEFFLDANDNDMLDAMESVQGPSASNTISYDPLVFPGVGELEVHVVVTDANGCSAIVSVTFDVFESPNPGVFTEFEACTGDIDLDDLLTADFPVTGGDWRIISSPAGVTITLDAANSANFPPGDYTINYQVQIVVGVDSDGNDILGCGISFDHELKVRALPELEFKATAPTCDNLSSGSIEITSNSGFPMPATYAWSNSGTGQSISGLTAGAYSVTVTDGDNLMLMCTNSYDIDVPAATSCNFDVALDKKVTTTGPYVPGQNVTFTITVYNQGSVDAHNINVVDYVPAGYIFNAADNTTSPNDWIANANGDPQHTVTSIDAGLSTTVTITLQIDPDYAGASLLNTAEIIGATNSAGMILMDEDSDLADTEPDPGAETDDEVADDAADIAGDQDDFDFAGICIDVQIAISGDDSICNTGDADITFTIAGGTAPYSIMYSDGTTTTNATTSTNETTITVSPTETTTYTIVAATDANGCPATVSGSATITVGNTSCTEFPWTGNE